LLLPLDNRAIVFAHAGTTAGATEDEPLTVGNYMLPSPIARFTRRYKDARFHVAVGNTDFAVASVRQFESDAGWVEGLARHPDLQAFPWREDRLVMRRSAQRRF
jgi:DNA-binding transcriptional LysR family regulator